MGKEEKAEIQQLFQQLKNGDKQVIEKLYNRYNKIVYGIAFSILKSKEDAEDVMQVVFSKLWTLDKEKLPQSNEGTWLYTVTKNEALAALKKKNNTIDLDTIYDLQDEDNEIENVINRANYNKLISELNDKEKEIVSLKIIAELSFDEISQILGEKTGTIKWRYYKALYRIKALLSNLAMFIVTFVMGIATLSKKGNMQSSDIIQDDAENSTTQKPEMEDEIQKPIVQEPEDSKDKTENSTESENFRDETNEEDEKQENTIVQDSIIAQENNYMANGFLAVSAVFLIATIILTIFFKKYQLKLKKKSSK